MIETVTVDGYEGRGCPSIEKHQLFVGFWQVHRMGGAGGWGAGGWAYRGGKLSRQRLQHPAAAAVGRSSVAAAKYGPTHLRRSATEAQLGLADEFEFEFDLKFDDRVRVRVSRSSTSLSSSSTSSSTIEFEFEFPVRVRV